MLFPQNKVAMAAADKKGPKGIDSFRLFILNKRRMPATAPPAIIPTSNETKTRGKPVTRPIRAASLTSPHPMPPREIRSGIKRKAKPMAPPMTPLAAVGQGSMTPLFPDTGSRTLIIRATMLTG